MEKKAEITSLTAILRFSSDLHHFARQLERLLFKDLPFAMDTFDLVEHVRSSGIQTYLSQWYYISINYIPRVLSILGNELPVFLHSAIMGKNINIKPHKDAEDVKRFLFAVRPAILDNPTYHQFEDDTVVVSLPRSFASQHQDPSGQERILNSSETNTFCVEWARELLLLSDSVVMKSNIDQKKSKVLQEFHYIHKLIGQAKMDHHALYAAYRVLKENKNQDVLLILLLKYGNNDSDTKEVIQVIFEYSKERETSAGFEF
eukprot:TRINITY_DN2596_c0_g1_i8.p1 TRINITY_DN2596_c0_g1~~TRINITY_DN2596_c0_g1_i8.p1  ORF type:complete len:260 (+),score=57.28 TRINITY_DN2596_c0_g1_i8:575-1354(+)